MPRGLEAGKTKIKYKEVEVGLVEHIAISDDLSHIVVTARMVKEAEPYMNDGTEFWIVRPRIGAGGVSGLGTLVSGAFVEVDPGSGEPTTSFNGLEEPPPILSDVAGRRFQLRAAKLGSVSRGSPVYYRDIEVGQVLGYQLADDNESLLVDVFVAAPHDQLVRDNSRFWNASGVDIAARRRRRPGLGRIAAGAARRRHRLRHPGDRPTGRARGRGQPVPAVRELPRRDRSRASPTRSPIWSISTARCAACGPARRSSSAACGSAR